MEENETDCPFCGEPAVEPEGPDSPGTWLRSSEPVFTFSDYGAGEEWQETHRCAICGAVFSFTNGYP